MGNFCVRFKRTAVVERDREIPQAKVEPQECVPNAAYVQIRQFGIGNKAHWMTNDLKQGSVIVVGESVMDDYWVWERTWEEGEPRWRLRLNPREDLYITYDATNNVTMQPSGPNSYFSVSAGEKGGYIFHVPGEKRYITENEDGILTLSSTATEWTLIVDVEVNRPGVARRDILVVQEDLTNKKWVCDDASPGAYVLVDLEYDEEKRAQWYRQYVAIDNAWHFQARKDDNLFVTCVVPSSEIYLQTGSNENRKERLVKGKGDGSIKMLDSTGTKFFNAQIEGRITLLALTDDELLATLWRFSFYGFDIDGEVIPPDIVSECCKEKAKESACDEQVAQEQAVEST